MPEETTARLANYVGAIAINRREGIVGLASPKGGAAVLVEAKTGRVLREETVPDAAGAAPSADGIAVSSYRGDLAQTRSRLAWDQHMIRIV